MNSPFSPQPSYPLSGESVLVIPPRFKQARNFSEGLAAVQVEVKLGRLSEDLWGFIDKKGNFVVEPQFNSVGRFSEGLAAVVDGMTGNIGYIDKTGKFVIQPQFEVPYQSSKEIADNHDFSDGLAVVGLPYYYIDNRGNKVTSFFPYAGDRLKFREGLAKVRSSIGGLIGYIDKTKKWVIQPQFEKAGNFSEGLAPATKKENNGKLGYIDKTGKWIIQQQFDDSSFPDRAEFSEGLASVSVNVANKNYQLLCGYIDKTGKWIIQPQFKYASNFSGGIARAEPFNPSTEEEKSYNPPCLWDDTPISPPIDKIGKRVIPPKYNGRSVFFDLEYGFSDGLALVSTEVRLRDKLYSYVDKKGNFIVKPRAGAKPTGFSEGLSAFAGGYIDKTGKWIIQPDFDEAYNFSNGLAIVKIDGKYGYIDKTGRWIIQPSFDKANDFSDGLAIVEIGGKYGYIRNPMQQQQVDTFSLFR